MVTTRRRTGPDEVYAAADQFRQRAFIADDSVFTPGTPIWTIPHLDELQQAFVDRPDTTKGVYLEKLERQLTGVSDGAIQLMAELHYLHVLIAVNKPKFELVKGIVDQMEHPVAVPLDLQTALLHGVAGTGTYFQTNRWRLVAWLIQFTRAMKELDEPARTQTFGDPWALKALAHGLPIESAYTQRSALLHLLQPATFEAVLNNDEKRAIIAWGSQWTTPGDEDYDRQLIAIRAGLTPTYGPDFDFYDERLLLQWRHQEGEWGEIVRWSRAFADSTVFRDNERPYKLEISERIFRARRLVLDDSSHEEAFAALREAFTKSNLVDYRNYTKFLAWCEEQPEVARPALQTFLKDGDLRFENVNDAIDTFLEVIPAKVVSGSGDRLSIASFLLFGRSPSEWPVFRREPFRRILGLMERGEPASTRSPGGHYRWFLVLLDETLRHVNAEGALLQDRLDAQSMLWVLIKAELPEEWPVEQRQAFLQWRSGESTPITSATTTATPAVPVALPSPDLIELGQHLFLEPPDYLVGIDALLRDERQLVFYGPPGTGKTYIAQALAEAIAGPDGYELVQFHPSYSYEDFVQGFRPKVDGTFELRDGPLLQAAAKARDRKTPYILIIDELNRGNVAKLFGELYFLLEYRDQPMRLQYSAGETFALPENLWVIGTMNTADRSIALVDAALRRRFHFVKFAPDAAPIAGLLERWLADKAPDQKWLATKVNKVNELLADNDAAIGPSYFMKDGLDESRIERIWNHQILPYIEERYYGEAGRVREFHLDQLNDDATDDDLD